MSAIEGEGTGSDLTSAYQSQMPSPMAQEVAPAVIQIQPKRGLPEVARALTAAPATSNEATSTVPRSSTQIVAVGPAGLNCIHHPNATAKTMVAAQAPFHERERSRGVSTC
jgi:hypothetical protein